jgi:hypothetical protein
MNKQLSISCLIRAAMISSAVLVSVSAAASAEGWATPVPPPPSAEQAAKFGFKPLDYQTTFKEARPDTHAPINNQTAVGVPGTVPMGFNYLTRLVYSEFEVNFTVQTDKGEKRPYMLPNFKQTSPGGWLPGAVSEWDYDGIHYELTYIMIPNDPQPVDLCQIVLKNTVGQPKRGRLFTTFDAAPSTKLEGDIISDRGKPLAVIEPLVPAERVSRDSGCVDPRAIVASPWHPGPFHDFWHHCRIGWYGQPVEYMLKSDGKPLQIVLGFMTSHHLCDAVETTVEGSPETKRVDLTARVMEEAANTGEIKPFIQRFTGKDTDGDGYIKISVHAAKDSIFQRAIVNIIQAFDEGVSVTDQEIISGSSRDKARHWVDVGADFFGEVNLLAAGKDPTVFAQRISYSPDLAPGETKIYLIKFPAIDRKEPAWCSSWPRPYDTKESWKGVCASTGRHPENKAMFGCELPLGTDPVDFATYGPKSRELWSQQLAGARAMDMNKAISSLKSYWEAYVSRGVRVLVPDLCVENLWKHQIAMMAIYRQQWWPHDYWMQMNGPDFYWEYCSRDGSYENVAWDLAGFPKESRSLLDTFLTPKSKLPTSRYPFGQWDDGSPEYDGAWQTRVNQWDTQGQTLRAIATHYLCTGDKVWLANHYEAVKRGAEWIIRRVKMESERIGDPANLAYGLMPEAGSEPPIGGGHSLYVNAYAVLGLKSAERMARDLAHNDDALRFEHASSDLAKAFGRAARLSFIRFNDFSGTIATSVEVGANRRANPTTDGFLTDFGGALVWPTEAIAPHDPLIDGFYGYQEKMGSTTGGLMEWPYVYVDFAIGYIRRNEPEKACDLFYAYVANSTGTNDWAECMQLEHTFSEFDPSKVGVLGTGDAPHGEACANYINFLRNLMLHEEGDTLHIAPATPRRWLAQPKPIGMEGAPSHFGLVNYHLQADPDRMTIRGDVKLDPQRKPAKLILHVRGPGGRGLRSVKLNGKVWDAFAGDQIIITNPPVKFDIEAKYKTQE